MTGCALSITTSQVLLLHRYMGIGLSAQGVNMNRLPGKLTLCVFVSSQCSLPLTLGVVRRVCVSACVSVYCILYQMIFLTAFVWVSFCLWTYRLVETDLRCLWCRCDWVMESSFQWVLCQLSGPYVWFIAWEADIQEHWEAKKFLWHLFSEGLPSPSIYTGGKTQHCTFLMQPSDCFEQPVWEN